MRRGKTQRGELLHDLFSLWIKGHTVSSQLLRSLYIHPEPLAPSFWEGGHVKLCPLRRRSRGERAPVKLGALCRRSRRGRAGDLTTSLPQPFWLSRLSQKRAERAYRTFQWTAARAHAELFPFA